MVNNITRKLEKTGRETFFDRRKDKQPETRIVDVEDSNPACVEHLISMFSNSKT